MEVNSESNFCDDFHRMNIASSDEDYFLQNANSPVNSIEEEKIHHLEEQYELLNSSLIALTTHFAQVQFRLRQIVEAAPDEKEGLLKSLEEFAFRGIPEMENALCKQTFFESDNDIQETLTIQRAKQTELIEQLKSQLADLESYAYEVGEGGLPQSMVLERQKVIIDQLKGQLNINIDNFERMTADELRSYVETSISQLINPLKMKEQLVGQLKTQIADLERFVQFLQGDSSVMLYKKEHSCHCDCSGCQQNVSKSQEQLRGRMLGTMKKITALLHMFATTQFHASRKFRRNSPKRSMKMKHWGDLRAQLEVAIEDVIDLASEPETYVDSDYVSDSETVNHCTSKLATVVRKKLAVSLQNLMRHGLASTNNSLSVVPFAVCFRARHPPIECDMHPWELILKFYDMKNGDQFNSTPARKLSQSFNLDIVGGNAISTKQSLLGVVGNIIASHDPYKRSYDAQFKAFVCAGLNNKALVSWLKLVLRCQPLIEMYYSPWSYVVKTGFEDSFASLDKLNEFDFNLPVDLAIRQLNDIKDAF